MEEDIAIATEKARKKKTPVVADAAAICREAFGLDPVHVKELDSYDDRNYIVTCATGTGLVTEREDGSAREGEQRFVLKIHNGVDSGNLAFLQGQNRLLAHLAEAGFRVPQAQPAIAHSIDGLIAVIAMPFVDGSQGLCAVRLLSFLDDHLMCEVSLLPGLFFDLGAFMARIDGALRLIEVPALHRHHLWDLANLPLLRRFLPSISDPSRRTIAETVSTQLKYFVVPPPIYTYIMPFPSYLL